MRLLSVTMFHETTVFVFFVELAGHRTARNVPKKKLLCNIAFIGAGLQS